MDGGREDIREQARFLKKRAAVLRAKALADLRSARRLSGAPEAARRARARSLLEAAHEAEQRAEWLESDQDGRRTRRSAD
jgi:hypothetical protein